MMNRTGFISLSYRVILAVIILAVFLGLFILMKGDIMDLLGKLIGNLFKM